jgi:glucose/arabinose dehydrogenase
MKRASNNTRVAISQLVLVVILTAVGVSGCYSLRSSSGGGQTHFSPPRNVQASDVAVPDGYRVEVVATGLTFPTGVAFDGEGVPHVVEAGYSYGEVWTTPRLLRIESGRSPRVIAQGERNGPWTGVVQAGEHFYIAEGGELQGGRILRVDSQGRVDVLIDSLPTMGDHHTNGPAIGPNGDIYFALGTATNSGVVGPDNAKYGWLKRKPDFHDVPCRDVRLTGETFASENVLSNSGEARTVAFAPFGRESSVRSVPGRVPCSGAILSISPNGGEPQLVAWGFRNPFGLAFSQGGELYVTENGYDDRGSRPVWGTADVLWAVKPNTWYGWPDFSAGLPLTDERFRPPGKPPLAFLLAEHPNEPPKPAAILGVHSSSNGLDFAPASFGYEGQAFVAQFGDQAPTVGKVLAPVGFKVVRVDVKTGAIQDFAANRGKTNGPASKIGGGGFERPVAVRFDPTGSAMYVVDFGVMLETKQGSVPQQGTGVLWKISRGAQP